MRQLVTRVSMTPLQRLRSEAMSAVAPFFVFFYSAEQQKYTAFALH